MIQIPVSVGELFDKITILQIKKEKIKSQEKLINVQKELDYLCDIAKKIDQSKLEVLIDLLILVNKKLWEIEDELRVFESKKNFGDEFIELARSVYKMNDKRASIKREISLNFNSEIIEEKDFSVKY